MRSWLSGLLKNLFGESIARALGGAGISLVSAAVLLPLVTAALNAAASGLNGLPGDLLNVMLLCGLGECLSVVGSAMLTRVAMDAGKIGLKKAAG